MNINDLQGKNIDLEEENEEINVPSYLKFSDDEKKNRYKLFLKNLKETDPEKYRKIIEMD